MVHPYPSWLDGKREQRRRLKDIKRFTQPEEIYKVISEAPAWNYKRNREVYEKRDRALVALLYLLGCRVNEVLKLRKSQFDFEGKYPYFVVIHDFEISKRKEKTIKAKGIPKKDFPLPLVGKLAPFTDMVVEYYNCSEEEMFKIGRQRAWAIVKHMTGKWCHYFRSQRLSYLVNLLRSSTITAKIMGIENSMTIDHYYKTEWEEHEEALRK